MKEDLKHVGSFLNGQGQCHELYIDKSIGLLHIYNNVESEEELHIIVRVEETSAGIDANLISGCDKAFWERLRKHLVYVLSTHAPDIINRQTGFKFKNLWEMWSSSYPVKGSSYQRQ